MSTGPSLGHGSNTSVGVGHALETSTLSVPVFGRNGSTTTLRATRPNTTAEPSIATCRPARVAMAPQTYEPIAWDPVATSRYTANPRAITHRGNDSCAAAFNVANVISHAIPDNTRKGVAAANGSQTTATGARAYAAADAASSTLSDTRWRNRAATTAASTAPKPMAPSATPYPLAARCHLWAAATGSRANKAEAGKRKSAARSRILRILGPLRTNISPVIMACPKCSRSIGAS